ncbi:MAG: dual specificity protein phosphatase family protein [Halobacteriales archaeon]
MTLRRFASAAPGEFVVFGAAAPGVRATDPATAVDGWVEAAREQGIMRIVVLLSREQLSPYSNLVETYRSSFGEDRVLHAPVPDHELADEETLTDRVLPFLRAADAAGEPTLVHCRAGLGRTGHVLAGWLVHARGYDPEAALTAVADTGRVPREAVAAGNATKQELRSLLSAARP